MAEGTDAADGNSSGQSSGSLLGTWPRRIAAVIVSLVAVVALLYLLGIVGVPSAGVEDEGDWGEVTDERTEIVTTVWVNNPNPIGVSFGDTLAAEYDIYMNDVRVAEGSKSDIDVPPGNSTMELRTDLINDRLPAWWVEFVRANETVYLDADATLSVDTVRTVEHDVHENETILADDTPISNSLSTAVNQSAGEYTQTVDAGAVDEGAIDSGLDDDASVTVGYDIRRGWAEWGAVDEAETTVEFHLLVHNPGDVPVPADPDGLGVSVVMNDVELFEGENDEFSVDDADTDAVLEPGETREITVEVRMDNEKIDEWFPRHVGDYEGTGAEETAIETQFQAVFEEPATGTTYRLPGDAPATYDCEFRTDILVDDQTSGTDCDPPTEPVGE